MTGAARVEKIYQGDRLVHAHQCFFFRTDLPFDERDMCFAADAVTVRYEPEHAVYGLDVPFGDTRDERLRAAAVLNEIGDRANLELMLRGELDQIGQSRHFPVLF